MGSWTLVHSDAMFLVEMTFVEDLVNLLSEVGVSDQLGGEAEVAVKLEGLVDLVLAITSMILFLLLLYLNSTQQLLNLRLASINLARAPNNTCHLFFNFEMVDHNTFSFALQFVQKILFLHGF